MLDETLESRLEANAGYVWQQARRAAERWNLPAEDLAQEGFIGLCIAHEKFRPDSGASFLTYSAYWVRERILRYSLNNHSLIRPPAHRFWNGQAPTLTCVSIQDRDESLSHDHHYSDSWAFELPDQSEAPTYDASTIDSVRALLATLKPRYRDVIQYRIFDGLTYREIARRLGVTGEAIRMMERRALKTLRRRLAESESLSRFKRGSN